MKVFKDNQQRSWTLTVNYTAREAVLAATGEDIIDVKFFERMGDNPAKIVDVLYALCKEQADRIPLNRGQFIDGLVGDAIDEASEALIQEIINFFPKRRRETLQKVHATANQVRDLALQQIDQKLESGELLRQLTEKLTAGSGTAPGSSESTPAPSPSASSS